MIEPAVISGLIFVLLMGLIGYISGKGLEEQEKRRRDLTTFDSSDPHGEYGNE